MVNLETENVTAIHGLGFKNWSNFKLDASDRDNGKIVNQFCFADISVPGFFVSKGIRFALFKGKFRRH